MSKVLLSLFLLIGLNLSTSCFEPLLVQAADRKPVSRGTYQESPVSGAPGELPPIEQDRSEFLAATTIFPYRSADIGSEVSGIIETYYFEEGDLLHESQVVAEISRQRYKALAVKARGSVESRRVAYTLAKTRAKVMKELASQGAATQLEHLKAESDLQMAEAQLQEAEGELVVAELNLRACQLKAPFTGYLTVRYKQPYESVQRLEKIFAIADSSRVYAVANVPARLLPRFPKGARVTFIDTSGTAFRGTVDRIGRLFNAKSNTKKVYALIDNSGGKLEIGMTGSLKPEKPEKQ